MARAARAGSREAFAQLVARHQGPLFRFLRMRAATTEDAEDLLQEAFLRCWHKLPYYDASRPFATWLYKLAANVATSQARRRRVPMIELVDVGGGCDPVALASTREERDNVWEVARRCLPAEPRSALWLFYAEGRSAANLAEILGKSEGAVRILLMRARDRLAAALAAREPTLVVS